jgi:hypothetical protein
MQGMMNVYVKDPQQCNKEEKDVCGSSSYLATQRAQYKFIS